MPSRGGPGEAAKARMIGEVPGRAGFALEWNPHHRLKRFEMAGDP